MRCALKITPIGNLGNQMLQLMLALAIQRRVPDVDVAGYDMPDWDLRKPVPAALVSRNAVRLKGQYVDFELVVSLLAKGFLGDIDLSALGFQVPSYLPRSEYVRFFPPHSHPRAQSADDALVINVRGAEILGNFHPDYGPIPVAFYRQLIETTGLRPVFLGQIGQDDYSKLLRRHFRDAEFIASAGARADFERIRSASNVVVSVSTFSWLAAWFSEATVHLPLLGIFNPQQRPDINLLPVDDSRYRFYEFPVRHWSASPAQLDALEFEQSFAALESAAIRRSLSAAKRRIRAAVNRYRAELVARAAVRRAFGIGGGVIMRLPEP